ncbi:hypothetical protein OBBRIDRAFT_506766 [Obba rivulosa]|uniref:Uncharacterized protein n=1 Tax=Obba rivulosa TaxID=1052685 RepID=A0A8E2DN06_9APHY|nr:hypothetical protein OBBRIDRAFT_506766 [Obba rivulosa]
MAPGDGLTLEVLVGSKTRQMIHSTVIDALQRTEDGELGCTPKAIPASTMPSIWERLYEPEKSRELGEHLERDMCDLVQDALVACAKNFDRLRNDEKIPSDTLLYQLDR